MRALLLLRFRWYWDARSGVNSTSRIDCRRPFFNCYRCCRLIALFLFRQDFFPQPTHSNLQLLSSQYVNTYMYYESATIIELHYTGTVGEVAGEARRMETCGKWPRSHYKSVLSKLAGKEMHARMPGTLSAGSY